jgi:hypothetical protein
MNSTAGATSRSGGILGIHQDPRQEMKRLLKEGKRRGRKYAQQLIREVGSFVINSGQMQKLTEGFFLFTPPPSS